MACTPSASIEVECQCAFGVIEASITLTSGDCDPLLTEASDDIYTEDFDTIMLESADPILFSVTNPYDSSVTNVYVPADDSTTIVMLLPMQVDPWSIDVEADGSPLVTLEADGCDPADCPSLDIKGFIQCRNQQDILGYGQDLRVLLMTRGAGTVIAELKPTSGSFTRVLDDTSTLSMRGVVTGNIGGPCCDGWEDVHAWATEVIVFRDGRDCWAGPVTHIEFGYGYVDVEADDLTAWWDRRVLPAMRFVAKDFADIFVEAHEKAMEPDPSPNILINVSPTNVYGTREILDEQYIYAHDFIHELADTSLDYTAYGRTIIVRGTEIEADPWLVLMDEHWTEPPVVSERGNEQATVVIVRGNGVTSTAIADAEYLSYYGYLVRTFDEETIVDQVSCDKAAQTRLAMLKDPLYIETPQGAKLKSTAPITLAQLIPGMRVRVDTQSTCRPLVADFRLEKVEVDFDGSVAIDLEPLGSLEEGI